MAIFRLQVQKNISLPFELSHLFPIAQPSWAIRPLPLPSPPFQFPFPSLPFSPFNLAMFFFLLFVVTFTQQHQDMNPFRVHPHVEFPSGEDKNSGSSNVGGRTFDCLDGSSSVHAWKHAFSNSQPPLLPDGPPLDRKSIPMSHGKPGGCMEKQPRYYPPMPKSQAREAMMNASQPRRPSQSHSHMLQGTSCPLKNTQGKRPLNSPKVDIDSLKLTCPICKRRFNIGRIQEYKRHVDKCDG